MTTIQMEDRLKNAYPDCDVAVLDARGTGDYFEVRISSKALKNLSRVKQHQAIMQLFSEELEQGEIHALSIKTM